MVACAAFRAQTQATERPYQNNSKLSVGEAADFVSDQVLQSFDVLSYKLHAGRLKRRCCARIVVRLRVPDVPHRGRGNHLFDFFGAL